MTMVATATTIRLGMTIIGGGADGTGATGNTAALNVGGGLHYRRRSAIGKLANAG